MIDCINELFAHIRRSSDSEDPDDGLDPIMASRLESLIQDPEESSQHTPLMLAAEKGNVAVVERLILAKADVNRASKSAKGRTGLVEHDVHMLGFEFLCNCCLSSALMLACANGHTECAAAGQHVRALGLHEAAARSWPVA